MCLQLIRLNLFSYNVSHVDPDPSKIELTYIPMYKSPTPLPPCTPGRHSKVTVILNLDAGWK